MLQGSPTFWLTILNACMNFSICRSSSYICWVAVSMQLTFLLFSICQLLHIFAFLGLIYCLTINFSVTVCFFFHSLQVSSHHLWLVLWPMSKFTANAPFLPILLKPKGLTSGLIIDFVPCLVKPLCRPQLLHYACMHPFLPVSCCPSQCVCMSILWASSMKNIVSLIA